MASHRSVLSRSPETAEVRATVSAKCGWETMVSSPKCEPSYAKSLRVPSRTRRTSAWSSPRGGLQVPCGEHMIYGFFDQPVILEPPTGQPVQLANDLRLFGRKLGAVEVGEEVVTVP